MDHEYRLITSDNVEVFEKALKLAREDGFVVARETFKCTTLRAYGTVQYSCLIYK
jgi:hypothetical protein